MRLRFEELQLLLVAAEYMPHCALLLAPAWLQHSQEHKLMACLPTL